MKEYLLKGYAVNQHVKQEQFEELKHTVKLLSNVLNVKHISKDEAVGLLKVITDYTYGLDVLDRYDYQPLEVNTITDKELFYVTDKGNLSTLYLEISTLYRIYSSPDSSSGKLGKYKIYRGPTKRVY